jgi:5-methylcytosine-specific restriction endonuclease McrA
VKRTPLKRTPIKRFSKKQQKINKVLASLDSTYPIDDKCQKCHTFGDWRGLVKHHKVFRSQGGEHTKENTEWLCGVCHSAAHGIKEV